MKLFAKKKEKHECSCGGNCKKKQVEYKGDDKDARIKILGSGCKNCQNLEKATEKALAELDLAYDIGHVRDFDEIAKYGVMSTPALVFDQKVLSFGKVLTVEEIKDLLKKEI